MSTHKIDFVDLIASVNVPMGQQTNYLDTYIDGRVQSWNKVTALIISLPKLKAVYFTRKTFGGIPNIHSQIIEIRNHCLLHSIRFCLLETPARFANASKQNQWIDTIVHQTNCLQP